jgi:hypothetical protein
VLPLLLPILLPVVSAAASEASGREEGEGRSRRWGGGTSQDKGRALTHTYVCGAARENVDLEAATRAPDSDQPLETSSVLPALQRGFGLSARADEHGARVAGGIGEGARVILAPC